MDLQIYALCEELERNPPSPDPKNDCFCDSPDSLDEHAMIETLDSQFKQMLQTELLPYQVSTTSSGGGGVGGDEQVEQVSRMAQLLRSKEECIQLCVARLSNIRSSMFKVINHEPQLIRLAARYYMEKEALVRRLGELVADLSDDGDQLLLLPRDLQKLRDENISEIFELPYGRERASRVAGVLERNAGGVV